MSVRIDTVSVKARLTEINDIARDNLKQATQQAVNNLLNLAKKEAPSDTGELQRKHRTTVKMNGNTIEGRVENYAEYGVYVHEGTGIYAKGGNGRKKGWGYTVESGRSKYQGFHWTRGNKPNSWMEKTVKDNTENVKRMYLNILKGGIT